MVRIRGHESGAIMSGISALPEVTRALAFSALLSAPWGCPKESLPKRALTRAWPHWHPGFRLSACRTLKNHLLWFISSPPRLWYFVIAAWGDYRCVWGFWNVGRNNSTSSTVVVFCVSQRPYMHAWMYKCDLATVSWSHSGKLGLPQSRKAASRLAAGGKSLGSGVQ